MVHFKNKALDVVFYKSKSGNEPVREWLLHLPRHERKIIGEDLFVVQAKWPIGKPLVGNLGTGLWGLRSKLPDRIARIMFLIKNDKIILLHGFIKKTQKTPTQDLKLGKKCKQEFEKR